MESDGILEHQGLRKQRERVKIQANSTRFLSPLEFSKFSLATEAKITTLSDVVLNVYREMFKTTISGESKKKNIRGKGFYTHRGK